MRQTIILLAWLIAVLFTVSCAGDSALRKEQSRAYRLIGEGYYHEGKVTAALGELLKAEKLYDKDPLLHHDLGLVYFAKGEFELAIVHFNKALRIKPDYSEALNYLGAVFLSLERWDDAIEYFNRARANLLYTTPHFSLWNLGAAYRGKKDYARSISFYEEALEVSPRWPLAYRGKALTYMAMGDYGAAISSLEKALNYAPRFALAHYDLGRAYAGSHNREKAIAGFKRVVELAPDSRLADKALAEIRKLQK